MARNVAAAKVVPARAVGPEQRCLSLGHYFFTDFRGESCSISYTTNRMRAATPAAEETATADIQAFRGLDNHKNTWNPESCQHLAQARRVTRDERSQAEQQDALNPVARDERSHGEQPNARSRATRDERSHGEWPGPATELRQALRREARKRQREPVH